MTSRCSAGVSEYISPVPPAAITALIGCANSRSRFSRRPARSRDSSFVNGVIGKAITPESLRRSSRGSIVTLKRVYTKFMISPDRRAPSNNFPCLPHGLKTDSSRCCCNVSSRQLLSNRRESLELLVIQPGNKRWNSAGLGNLRFRHRGVENSCRPPGIAQIFERDKLRTQLFSVIKISTLAGSKQRLAQVGRDTPRPCGEARKFPVTEVSNSGSLADAADHVRAVHPLEQAIQIIILSRVFPHDRVLNADAYAICNQAADSVQAPLFVRAETVFVLNI